MSTQPGATAAPPLDARARRQRIYAQALPIIGGMASQNLLNLVDAWMIGALGAAALAGVGLASFLVFVAVAFISGLAPSVQSIAAQRYGAGRFGEAARALNGGLLLSLAIGIPVSVLLIAFTPSIMAALNPDPAVQEAGAGYLMIRLVAVAFVGMNFAFRGYWSAIDRARYYFVTIVSVHVLNVAISYPLIFGLLGLPALGVHGAAIGTAASLMVGTLIHIGLGLRFAAEDGLLRKAPQRDEIARLLRLGIPNAVQQFLFAAGFTALFWIVGQIGTQELAVAHVLVTFTLVAVLPGLGFGIAAASLAAQAIGRGAFDEAAHWPWAVYKVSLPIFIAIAAAALLATDPLLALFLRDDALVAIGSTPLRLFGAGVLIDAVGLILMHALLGAGAARLVMVTGVGLQWLCFLPAAYLLGPVLGFGLTAVWLAMVVWRGAQAVIFTLAWQGGSWRQLRV
ncbi:MATE family efflux transporter [Algiphilus sp.]|uniref:MATE family efflux transporter n=1 Tax=Algiphilus sp. TaxID=1872431 RepID=UPI0032EC39BE